jgi:hypothetical protein
MADKRVSLRLDKVRSASRGIRPAQYLDQLQEDAVFGLVTAWAVVADDFDEIVEQGRTLAAPRAADPGLDIRTVRRMAGEEPLQP